MDATTQVPPGPPPPPGPGSYRPPLVRSRTNRIFAGVAGGLGYHLGIDPVLIRIAFALLAFAGGLGIVLYLIAWVLIPDEGAEASVGDGLVERVRRSPPWVPIVLFVIAGLILLGRLAWGGPIFWSLALIAAGVWLYHNDSRRAAPPPPPPGSWTPPAPWTPPGPRTPAGPGTPPAPWSPPGAGAPPASPIPPAPTVPLAPTAPPAEPGGPQAPGWTAYRQPAPRPMAPPRPPRPRSPLGRYTVAAMLVVLGVAAAVDNVGAYHVPGRAYPALALLVVGAGLLVGAFWGRSRLLILLGLAILPLAFAASLVRVPIKGGTGDRLYVPQSVQEVRSEYRLAAGQIRLDLRQFQWGTEPVSVRLSAAAGNIEVLVPPQVTVNFWGHAGAGEIDFFDQVRNGIDITLQSVDRGTAQGGPRLDLNADLSVGRISVIRPGQLGRTGDFPPVLPRPGASASG